MKDRASSGKAEETSLKVHKATAKDSKVLLNQVIFSQDIYCGGYSGEDPPLPIPNREVKLTIADGTAPPGGRVGSCHALNDTLSSSDGGVFRYTLILSLIHYSTRYCSQP